MPQKLRVPNLIPASILELVCLSLSIELEHVLHFKLVVFVRVSMCVRHVSLNHLELLVAFVDGSKGAFELVVRGVDGVQERLGARGGLAQQLRGQLDVGERLNLNQRENGERGPIKECK